MIPRRPLFWLLWALLLLAAPVCFVSHLLLFWGVLVGLALLVAIVDAFLVRIPSIEVVRQLPQHFALGQAGKVTITITNLEPKGLLLEWTDGLPRVADSEQLPHQFYLPGGRKSRFEYQVSFHERGEQIFAPSYIRVSSPLRLWSRAFRSGLEQSTKVYPNYEPIVRFALLAMAHRLDSMGIIQKNRAGLSRDFHQLRDYKEGDAMSQIDWKASSRRRVLISREYREQRDQTLVFMLDCGNRLRALDGELSQFDHCLNAMLLLSYIALQQGDQVGVLSFGGQQTWLPPVKGPAGMTRLLNHLYSLQTEPEVSDYEEAAQRFLALQKRRSLVVMITNLRGEDASELLRPLTLLRQKHLITLASLQELSVNEATSANLLGPDAAFAFGAAQIYQNDREAVVERLRQAKIDCIESNSTDFPVALANHYLQIKSSGRL